MRALIAAQSCGESGARTKRRRFCVELVFGLHADDNAVDPILAARIGETKIGDTIAVVFGCDVGKELGQRIRVDALDRRPYVRIVGGENALQEDAARMDGDVRTQADAIDHARVIPAPVEKIEGELHVTDVRTIERGDGFLHALHRNAERQHRSVFQPLDQPLPDGAVERRHVFGAMQQETIDMRLSEGVEGGVDAGIDRGPDVAPRRIGREFCQRAELGNGANGLARAQGFAETLLGIAVGARGIELRDPGIDRAGDQTAGLTARGFSRPVGRAIGEPQLDRSQYEFRRARFAHARQPPGPNAHGRTPW